ncbi:MAG: hypothetical protein ACXVB9_01905 [Bdellovibrionota bacterium]
MRRILLAFFLLLFVAVIGGSASLYFLRDRLILRAIHAQTEKLAPSLIIKIGELHTSLLGLVRVELEDLEVHEERGADVKIKLVTLESRFTLPGLYAAWKTKGEIPLSVTASGLNITMESAEKPLKAAPAKPAPWPTSLLLPLASPVPLDLDLSVVNGDLSGPARITSLAVKLHARIRDTGLEATLESSLNAGLGGSSSTLPVSFSTKMVASRAALLIQALSFRAAGLEGSGSGELNLSPVRGKFGVTLSAPDLARVSLRPEDRAALGLTSQPSGGITFRLNGEAGETGKILAAGSLSAKNLSLPLNAPEHTAFAVIASGSHIDGTVQASSEIPFRAELSWPPGNGTDLTVQNAKVAFDLTQAAVSRAGMLKKPRGVPLKGDLSFSSGKNGVDLPVIHLTFHTLQLAAAASLPAPLGSTVGASFRLAVSNLAGFPALLPALTAAENKGASLEDAQGSIQAEGRLNFITAAPANSTVELKTFAMQGLRLPLAYSSDTASLHGALTGSAAAAGKYTAGDLNVSRMNGNLDLGGIEISSGKFAKKRGKKLTVAFDAKGTPARLQISRASLTADGLTASISGSAAFDQRRNATLNLATTLHAELAPLREYLPKMPAKISAGTFDAAIKVGGTWIPAGGIEKSPLLVSGKLTGKMGTVTMPEPPKSAETAAKAPIPAAVLPSWPAARNANVSFRVDLAQFQRGALTAKGIGVAGAVSKGRLSAAASVAQLFGGKGSLKNLSASLLEPRLAVAGAAGAEGLDLSQMAAFVDPSYGKIVKGTLKADSTFSVPDLWSPELMNTAAAAGKAEVRNGYLSTASFDGLVNEKLKGIPGVGDKAKITSGGVAAEIHTAFSAAKGILSLQNFVADTPKKDEMRLGGTLNLAFDCDLTGEAHLSSAPVTGPIREANSDPQGRLVVPVHFHGNLKSPQADIATGAIQAMLQKTASHEADKLKTKALDAAKAKAQDAVQDAAGGLFDQFKKTLKK